MKTIQDLPKNDYSLPQTSMFSKWLRFNIEDAALFVILEMHDEHESKVIYHVSEISFVKLL